MKKSQMLQKLSQLYGVRHCMVEAGYITPEEFMEEVLHLVEHHGMRPPFDLAYYEKHWRDRVDGYRWEDE